MWHESKVKEYIKIHLTKDRYNHSLGVMKTSEELAIYYGIDPSKARMAALCHDCAKYFSANELINKARGSGQIISSVYYKSPQLLHGIVGAYIAKELFHVEDEDVLNAIKYHTTGREAMSTLEKIVYIADCIEPARSYKGVKELRSLAYDDLDKAILKSFEDTIMYILSRGSIIHVDTIKARNYLLMSKKLNIN
ncbi:MAG: bis(5'-nucleosyl)-tetraphosphatase (symmetrical) YqeK [Clostridium sp.]|uniref:bis(5'-nucleosyl)-tetraphosphatase (symmetrical) YqeK n=1 Tax=Clostridium sp. TaxID=1506 RepID=UPI00305C8A7B